MAIFDKTSKIAILGAVFGSLTLAVPAAADVSGAGTQEGHGYWLAEAEPGQDQGHGHWLANLPREGWDDRMGHGHWLAGAMPAGSAQGYGHWLARVTPGVGLAYNQVIASLDLLVTDGPASGPVDGLSNTMPRDGKGHGHWLA